MILFSLGAQAKPNMPSSFNYSQTYRATYPNGDFYLLFGHTEKAINDGSFVWYRETTKFLAQRGFRLIFNPNATIADLQEALKNPNTSGIIWDGHGLQGGGLFDSRQFTIPLDTFSRPLPRLKYFLLGACHGLDQIKMYGIPGSLRPIAFPGKVTAKRFFEYLDSHQAIVDLESRFGKKLPRLFTPKD